MIRFRYLLVILMILSLMTSCVLNVNQGLEPTNLEKDGLKGNITMIKKNQELIQDDEVKQVYTNISTYKDGMITKDINYFNDEESSTIEFSYNNFNKLEKVIHYKDTVIITEEYIYDENNRLVTLNGSFQNLTDNPDNDWEKFLPTRFEYEYKDGNVEIKNAYDIEGEFKHCIETMYREDRQPLHEKTTLYFDDETIYSETISEYNEDNKLIFANVISDDKDSASTRRYFYDDNNNLIKIIYKNNDKERVYEYDYKFDKHDNWIEQNTYIDGVHDWRITREITYKE